MEQKMSYQQQIRCYVCGGYDKTCFLYKQILELFEVEPFTKPKCQYRIVVENDVKKIREGKIDQVTFGGLVAIVRPELS